MAIERIIITHNFTTILPQIFDTVSGRRAQAGPELQRRLAASRYSEARVYQRGLYLRLSDDCIITLHPMIHEELCILAHPCGLQSFSDEMGLGTGRFGTCSPA